MAGVEDRTWWRPRLRVGEAEEDNRHATWLELFFDLIFVVAVAELGRTLGSDLSAGGVAVFVGLFVPVWWAWVGHTFYANRFDADDLGHRLLSAVQMLAIAGLAASAHDAVGGTSAGFALSYLVVRGILVAQYLRAGRHIPPARPLTYRYARGFGLAAGLWLVSVAVPGPFRFALWAAALAIDFGTPLTARHLQARLPPALSHLPERFGLFTLIVLGEVVAAIVGGLARQGGGASATVGAAMGLSMAVSFWWIYFENADGSAIRRILGAGQVWIYSHLPWRSG